MRKASERLLHHGFRDQVLRTPDAVAIVENARSVTYAILADRVTRVSAELERLGIGRRSLVGLHLERSADYVVALLGVLASGAAVVPLPPTYPTSRKREVVGFAALSVVIVSRETPLDESLDVLRLSIDALTTADLGAATGWSDDQDPDQAAFVLSSSGSTGVPKMIVRSHRSFFHRLEWTWEQHPYGPREVCCQKSHMTTTHAIYELFEPLLRGVPIVVVSDAEVRNLEQFWDTVHRYAVSRLLLVPSLLRASLDLPGFVAPPLDMMVLMGEHVPRTLVERTLAAFPPSTRLFSIYGSTEASSTLVSDLRAPLPATDDPPLGVPLSDDVAAFVLTPDGTPVAPGETGRLYIAGTALFSGYLRDTELTTSALHPADGVLPERYDTRDDVRQSVDGSLHFVGRTDHVVKVRGFRVDRHEVERALQRIAGISQAVVVTRIDDVGATSIQGFVTPASADCRAALGELRDQLPAYMVPSRLQALDALPMTRSGKVDRQALAERADTQPVSAAGESAIEQQISDVWAQTLGHHQFSADEGFFEVGGTSLSVFVLLARLRELLQLDRTQLSDTLVYRYPTVRELAHLVTRIRAGQVEGDDQSSPILVTLRRGRGTGREPFFVVASAGGTLGAYERLTRALETERDIIGVRDTFLWGKREPTEGFSQWVSHYVKAIRERQPDGPYHIGAYSSAGAFGYEVAQRLREAGQEVALLVLIDPIGIDLRDRGRFGWWAMRASYAHPLFRLAVRLIGRVRPRARPGRRRLEPVHLPDASSGASYERTAHGAVRSKAHLLALSALLELNSGLAFGLSEEDFDGLAPEQYLGVLQARVREFSPEMDGEMLERLVVQYRLQVDAQNNYELQRYDGTVVLVEPESPSAGLLALLFRAFVRDIERHTLPIGEPSTRTRALTERFGVHRNHYRCMRDEVFVRALALRLQACLR